MYSIQLPCAIVVVAIPVSNPDSESALMYRMTRRLLSSEALTKQERANSSEKGNAQCEHVGPLDERHGSSDGSVLIQAD